MNQHEMIISTLQKVLAEWSKTIVIGQRDDLVVVESVSAIITREHIRRGISTKKGKVTIRSTDIDGVFEKLEERISGRDFILFSENTYVFGIKENGDGSVVVVAAVKYNTGVRVTVLGRPIDVDEWQEYSESLECPDVKPVNKYVDGRSGVSVQKHTLDISDQLDTSKNYPYLEDAPEETIRKFIESDCGILILIGQPGTGKSTWLRQGVFANECKPAVVTDTRLLQSSDVFDFYLSDSTSDMLIVEDCDAHLKSRESGNDAMVSILAAGDGFIKRKHKKIIFSTNLRSLKSIDEALLRPGRCYDVIEFKKLTGDQANTVIETCGLGDGHETVPVFGSTDEVSLSEVFGAFRKYKKAKRNSIGFTADVD